MAVVVRKAKCLDVAQARTVPADAPARDTQLDIAARHSIPSAGSGDGDLIKEWVMLDFSVGAASNITVVGAGFLPEPHESITFPIPDLTGLSVGF